MKENYFSWPASQQFGNIYLFGCYFLGIVLYGHTIRKCKESEKVTDDNDSGRALLILHMVIDRNLEFFEYFINLCDNDNANKKL